MDLYEALKAGTSAEELLAAFHKDLDAAQTRIDEETSADQEYLADCRTELADAILNYTEALCEDWTGDLTIESVEEILIGLEKELEGPLSTLKKLDKILSKKEGKKPVGVKVIHTEVNDDDDILQRFLNNLK